MLAGRELDPTQLAQLTQGDQSWVNQHITYTHGYGLVMVPVNEVQQGGQPSLLVKDIPPVSAAGAPKITQPDIYFGTQPSNYVIVDATSQEFDYPSASGSSGDQYTSWTRRFLGSCSRRASAISTCSSAARSRAAASFSTTAPSRSASTP
jgi:hypothetical protein